MVEQKVTFVLLCALHCAKHFTCLIILNYYNNSMRWLLSHFTNEKNRKLSTEG